MRKLFFIFTLIICTFIYGQECVQTDLQQAYVTVSLNDNMTVHAAVYSLSDTTKVNFAVGNLMYRPKTRTWKLADHQYDFVGGQRKEKSEDNLVQNAKYGNVFEIIGGVLTRCENTGGTNKNVSNPNYEGWIDLFPFDSAKNIHFVDTVHNFIYRTPTVQEFQYLVGGFKIAGDTIGRKDYEKLRGRGRIIVNDSTFINGLILLPDMPDSCSSIEECILKIMPVGTKFKSDYDGCWYYKDNIFTAAEWDVLEKQGAVFLPAGGGVSWNGSSYDFGQKYNRSGFYWTYDKSGSLEFGGYPYYDQGQPKNTTPSFIRTCNVNNRRAIRVVREEKKTNETPVAYVPKTCHDYKWGKGLIETEGGKIKIDSIDECTYGLKAVPKNGYKFVCFKDLGSLYFDDTVTLEIDTTIQNYVYEATFVRDNAYIYKWLDDSIIIRTDTTDLLSGVNTSGWSYTLINDSVRMTDEDERIIKLDWGIWKSDVTEVINRNEYAGLPLHMIIHNSCDKPSAVIDTIIPIVVHDTMYAHTMEFPNVPHCDLQILEDAVLYVDSNIVISGILDIHEGGKVVINEGDTLTAQGIILRGDGITQKWAQLLIKGEIHNLSEPLIYYDYTLNDTAYFPLSLPDTVQQSLIMSSITGLPTTWTSYWYNTTLRNTHHTGWEVMNTDYILGNGYIMWSDPNQWKGVHTQKTNIIRYPIRVTLANEKDFKTIDIHGSTDSNIKESDKNWNLIGNPYLSNYIVGPGSNLVEILPKDQEYVSYITYSIDGYRTYKQESINNFILKPFNSYFIQTISDGEIEFERYNLQYMFLPKRVRDISELRTGITLTQNNRTEHIGLLYGNYTDEYEINADLAKMFGFAPVMYAYSLSQNEQLAFQAVSIDSIYPIPVGYRNAKIEPMTFAFDNTRYTSERLAAIWLHDSNLNKHTNLLNSDYTFTPNTTNEDNRFYITVEFNVDIPTDIDNVKIENEYFVFDILGRRISETFTNGVYIIYENGKYTKVMK